MEPTDDVERSGAQLFPQGQPAELLQAHGNACRQSSQLRTRLETTGPDRVVVAAPSGAVTDL